MTNDCDDHVNDVPVIHGGCPSTPHGGSISPANTSPYNIKYG